MDLINNASHHQTHKKQFNLQRTEQNKVQLGQQVQTSSNTSNNNVKRTSSYTAVTGSKNSIQKSKSERYVWKKRPSSSNNVPDTSPVNQANDAMKIRNKTVENRTIGFPETKNPNINFESVSTGQSRYSFKRNVTQPQRQQNLSSEKSVVSVKNSLPQGQTNSATGNTSQNVVFQRNLCISDQVKIPLPQGQACSATGKTSLKFVSQRNLSSDKSGSSNVKHSLPRGQINSATGNTRQNVVYQRNLSSEKSVSSNVKHSKYKLVKTDSSAESTSRASEPVKLQEAANTVKLTSSISNSDICEKPLKLENESTDICSLKSKNISESEKCKNISSGNISGSSDFKKVERATIKNCNSDKNILSCDQSKSESEIEKKGDRKKDVISPSKKNVVEMLKKQLTATSDNLQHIKKSLSQTLLTNKQPGDNNHGNIDTKLSSNRQSASTGGNTNVTLTSKPRQSEFKARYKYQKTNAGQSTINSHAKLPPFTHSASSRKKPYICLQTQMVANFIKSKYRIGNYQTHWNKLCKTTVKNPTSLSPDMRNTTVNMSKFYDRMAKKYGWTDLGAIAQKVNMKKFYAKMAKKYGWTNLDSGSTSRVNMKKFQIKMAKKYGWTDADLKKSGFHTASTARLPNRHTRKLHAYQSASFFTNRKYRHLARLPHASRMRLDRRKVSPKPLITGLRKGTHLVLLNGVLYSSNMTSMSKVVADRSNTKSRFTVNRQMKKNYTTSFSSNHGPIESANRSWNTTRFLASKAINRSIAMATAKCRKDKRTTLRQYCKFYNRFGRCNRGDNCPYIHDPERIAVCTRFLRGTCKVVDCPFSHKVAKEKMPVCTYFLKGVCNRDDCPYLHVNVSKSAIICPDFLNGYCSLGEKCKKKHTRICPEFLAKRTCSAGKKCNLIHLTSEGGGGRKKRKSISKSSDTENRAEKGKSPSDDTPGVKDRKRGLTEENDNEPDIPFKYRKLPTFISLDSNQGDKKSNLDVDAQAEKKQTPDTKGIRIKPQL